MKSKILILFYFSPKQRKLRKQEWSFWEGLNLNKERRDGLSHAPRKQWMITHGPSMLTSSMGPTSSLILFVSDI